MNVLDYEGPLASYTAGVQSGHATIDSVRAVLNSGFSLARNETKYVLWGYSGGALTSEWAMELQVQYAPELNFASAALGGLTPNVTSVLKHTNGGPECRWPCERHPWPNDPGSCGETVHHERAQGFQAIQRDNVSCRAQLQYHSRCSRICRLEYLRLFRLRRLFSSESCFTNSHQS